MPDELFFTFNRLSEEDEKFIRDTIDQVGYTFYLTNALKRRFDKRVILVGKFGQGLFAFGTEYKKFVAKWIKLNVVHNHYSLGDCFGDVSIAPSEIFLGIKEGATVFPYKEHEQVYRDSQTLVPPDSKKTPESETSQSQSENKLMIKKEKSGIYRMTQKLSKKKKPQIIPGISGSQSSQQGSLSTSNRPVILGTNNPSVDRSPAILTQSQRNMLLENDADLSQLPGDDGKMSMPQLTIIGAHELEDKEMNPLELKRRSDSNEDAEIANTASGNGDINEGDDKNGRYRLKTRNIDFPSSIDSQKTKKTYRKRYFVTPIMRTEIAPIIRTDICIDKKRIIYFYKKSELYSVDIKGRKVNLLFNLKSIKSLFIKEMQGEEYIVIFCKQKVYYGTIEGFTTKENPMLKEKAIKIPLVVVGGEVYTSSEGVNERIDIERLLLTNSDNYIIETCPGKIEGPGRIFRKNYFAEPISFPRGSPYVLDKSSNCYLAIDKAGVIMSINSSIEE